MTDFHGNGQKIRKKYCDSTTGDMELILWESLQNTVNELLVPSIIPDGVLVVAVEGRQWDERRACYVQIFIFGNTKNK
jgi:hypothetical protein